MAGCIQIGKGCWCFGIGQDSQDPFPVEHCMESTAAVAEGRPKEQEVAAHVDPAVAGCTVKQQKDTA